MADIQVEHGYTRIANGLLDALARAALPGARHFQVMLAMIRLTYGYNRVEDRISASQVSTVTGIDPANVRRLQADLVSAGMLVADSRKGRITVWRVQKDPERWSNLGRRRPRSRTTQVVDDLGHVRPTTQVVDDLGTQVTYDLHQRQKDSSPKTEERSAAAHTPRKRSKPASTTKPKKPAQALVAAFHEVYLEERGVRATTNGKDGRFVKDMLQLSEVSAEQLKAAARVYFADKDPFAIANSYPLWLLVDRFQRYDVRAQKKARHGTLDLVREPEPEPSEPLISLRSATPWSQ